jgi:hypothetical protein
MLFYFLFFFRAWQRNGLDVAVKKYICEHFWRYLHRIEATIINKPFNIVLFRACIETNDAHEFLEFDI